MSTVHPMPAQTWAWHPDSSLHVYQMHQLGAVVGVFAVVGGFGVPGKKTAQILRTIITATKISTMMEKILFPAGCVRSRLQRGQMSASSLTWALQRGQRRGVDSSAASRSSGPWSF